MKLPIPAKCASCRSDECIGLRVRRLAFVLAGLLPAIASAQSQILVDPLGSHPPELRRAELKRALVHSVDSPPVTVTDRRRLSAEERDALHRDLRDAMRGAYRDGDKRGRATAN